MNHNDPSTDHDGAASVSRRSFLGAAAAAAAAAPVAAKATGVSSIGVKPRKTPRWGFLIDVRKCVGCFACTVSCKTENDVPLGVFRNDVKVHEHGEFPNVGKTFLPTLCNHCEKPHCVTRCPTEVITHTWKRPDGTSESFQGKKATYQRPDGLVLIDQSECWGCGNCINACPYGVRFYNPTKTAGGGPMAGKLKAADKCDMCVHRLDAGIVPSCVNTCQGRARLVGDLNDPNSEISRVLAENRDEVQVLLPEMGTEPRCFYIGVDDVNLAYKEGVGLRDEVERA